MRALVLALLALPLAGCVTSNPDVLPATLVVTSSAFEPGADIPRLYTCQGSNASPPLRIANVSANATALALIMDDPDATRGTFTHWTFWNLPPGQANLTAGVSLAGRGAREGNNSAGRLGYTGPCPPTGSHRYFFRAYALDVELQLPEKAGAEQLRDAMAGHLLARGELMGRYARS